MSKLNWDRVAKENVAARNGAEHIETETSGRRWVSAVRRWEELTESLKRRGEQSLRLRVKKKEGDICSLPIERDYTSVKESAISIKDLAEELKVPTSTIIRQVRSRGIKFFGKQTLIPSDIAEKIRRRIKR
ncbi:MAG: hypothetical protein M3444_07775 [Acidobacteriota bacterium]|nr:hypothetical protein [Acidobacteriota bacterium]MDQ5839091.1 hypothetical protein [Acidobacteriota bacterium]